MLERVGNETAVQPALVDVADVEAEDLGDAVVIDADRPTHVDRKPVDVLAPQPRIVERFLEGDAPELELRVVDLLVGSTLT